MCRVCALVGARDGDLGQSGKAELARGGRRHVDHAAAHEWTAIVDGDDHGTPIALVRDLHLGAEWQVSVRGGECPGIQSLPACGPASTLVRIHRGKTGLVGGKYMIEMSGKKLIRQDRRSQDQDSSLHYALLSLRHDAALSPAASDRRLALLS